MLRLPVMADTETVTLGFIGWASVSMTTTIWAVCRETLLKDMDLGLLVLPKAEAWRRASERQRKGLGDVFVGEEWGVEEADGGLLEVYHVWFGSTFFM